MTYLKSVQIERRPNLDKGSTYGIASRWLGHHSFQGSQGSSGSRYSNRAEVLSSQAAIFPLQVAGTIVSNETEEPTSQRAATRTDLSVYVLPT